MSRVMYGTHQNDLLEGTLTEEYTMYGYEGKDTLVGNIGNDVLFGDSDDDLLIGNGGDDHMTGGSGNDVYKLSRGFGNDVIYEMQGGFDGFDVIEFTDIASSEVKLFSQGDDLVIRIENESDSIRISEYFLGVDYRIEQIKFSDGVVWDRDWIKDQFILLNGTNEADVLHGMDNDEFKDSVFAGSGNDIVYGYAGEDSLHGEAGNDFLYGGSGSDYLYGDEGADTLNGGEGDDSLNGGVGNDTYLIQKGSGIDIIKDYDQTVGNIDSVKFGIGLDVKDAIVVCKGADLEVGFKSGEKVVIKNHLKSSENRVEHFYFEDGSIWDLDAINRMKLNQMGTENDDVLYGTDGSNILFGRDGNDYMYGNDGEDYLDGGLGNDLLTGGRQKDTYYFNKWYGKDTINDFDTNKKNIDTVKFGADLSVSDAKVLVNGNDLEIAFGNGSDTLKVWNYFKVYYYEIERFEFADGTVWDKDAIIGQLTQAMAIHGSSTSVFEKYEAEKSKPLSEIILASSSV